MKVCEGPGILGHPALGGSTHGELQVLLFPTHIYSPGTVLHAILAPAQVRSTRGNERQVSEVTLNWEGPNKWQMAIERLGASLLLSTGEVIASLK